MGKIRRKLATGFAITCALGGAAVMAPAPAFAAQPHCGDTIKHDVTLTHDLNCTASSSDGLDIGRDGVDINLNGHRIVGPEGSYYGVATNGYDSVTVRNGSIRGFGYGIYSYYSSKLNLSNLKINLKGSNDYYGVYVNYGQSDHIDRVTVDNAYYAFYLYDNDGFRMTRSAATHNDSTVTYGLYDGSSSGKVDHFRAPGAYYGAYLNSPTPGYTISNSTFNNAGYAGIYVSNSTPLWMYRYTLTDNTADSAGTYGFYANYDVKGSGNSATGAGTQNYVNVPH